MTKSVNKKHILIIEDQEHLRSMLTSVFEFKGFKVYSAFDGEEGLKAIEEQVPDIIILDLILPKKDGFEVMSSIKKNPRFKHIPIIVLTNLEDNKNIERALSLGAYSYLVKSDYTLDEIVEKVEEILNKNNNES